MSNITQKILKFSLIFTLALCIGLSISMNLAPHSQPASAQDDASSIATIADDFFTNLVPFGFSGSFMIYRDGEILLEKGYGIANQDTGDPVTADTVFGIGSIAKDFTSAAIMSLEKDGLLHTEDPISLYFDDVPADKADITIQQLLDHTGGLESYHDTEGDFQFMTRAEAQTAIFETPLLLTPGTEESYSNSGYTLLAMIVEHASGQTIQDYIHATILEPYGLDRTGFYTETFDNFAFTPNNKDGYGSAQTWDYTWALAGNGGMVSTVIDLYKFVQVLQGDDFLPVELKQKGHLDPNDDLFFAGGSDAHAYNSVLAYFAEEDYMLIGMSNQRQYRAEESGIQLYYMLEGEAFGFPPKTISAEADSFTDYAGTYTLESGGEIVVTAEEGFLTIGARGQDAVNALVPTRDEIYAQFDEATAMTQWLFDTLQADDRDAINERLGEPTAQYILSEWDQVVADLGAFDSITIIGSTVADFVEDTAVFVEAAFENETIGLTLIWFEGNEFSGYYTHPIDEQPLPSTTRFLPISDTEFGAYRLFFLNNPTVQFTIEDGNITGLTVSSVNGDTIATRTTD